MQNECNILKVQPSFRLCKQRAYKNGDAMAHFAHGHYGFSHTAVRK